MKKLYIGIIIQIKPLGGVLKIKGLLDKGEDIK